MIVPRKYIFLTWIFIGSIAVCMQAGDARGINLNCYYEPCAPSAIIGLGCDPVIEVQSARDKFIITTINKQNAPIDAAWTFGHLIGTMKQSINKWSAVRYYFGFFPQQQNTKKDCCTGLMHRGYRTYVAKLDYDKEYSKKDNNYTSREAIFTLLQPKGTFAKRRRYAALGAGLTALGAVGMAYKYLSASKSCSTKN